MFTNINFSSLTTQTNEDEVAKEKLNNSSYWTRRGDYLPYISFYITKWLKNTGDAYETSVSQFSLLLRWPKSNTWAERSINRKTFI